MKNIDTGLLFQRTEDARIKLKDLAKSLHKSPQRLNYTLALWDKEQIIRDPYSIIDYSYFGLLLFRVYFRGGYIGEHDKKHTLQMFADHDYAVSIYELTGEFDLAVEFASKNPSRFNKEFKKILSANPHLNDYKILLNVVTHIYPRFYLLKNTKVLPIAESCIVGGDREVKQFSNQELTVIKSLLFNPTIKLTDLAEKSGLNIKTAKKMLKSLSEEKIIRGYKFLIDLNKLGVSSFRLFIRLHNITPDRETQLIEYLFKTDEIIQLNKTIGDWDLEIDMESLDSNRIRSLIMELRGEFKDIIERFNLIQFYACHKKTYLPSFLFDNTDSS